MKKDPDSASVLNAVKSEKDDDGEQDSEQDDPTGVSLPGKRIWNIIHLILK